MKFLLVCAVFWLTPGAVFSDPGRLSDYLLVKINKNASLYSDGLDNYCMPNLGKVMTVSGFAVVYAKYLCQINGYDYGDPMYLISYRGKLYKVRQADVVISFEDKEKLNEAPILGSDVERSSVKEKAIQDSKTLFAHELALAIGELNKISANGIAIADFSLFGEGKYAEGTSFLVKFYNSSRKTIKYVNLSALGLNAVGDPVRASGRSAYAVLRGIGPIEPAEFGTYKKAYAWPTDLVQRMRIISVKVEYMDGSSSKINNVGEIFLSKETSNLLVSINNE